MLASSKSLTKIENLLKRTLRFMFEDYSNSYERKLKKPGKFFTEIKRKTLHYHSILQRISLPWNIDLTPFYLGSPKSSKSVRPPLMSRGLPSSLSATTQNFEGLVCPLEMYPGPKKTHFLKKLRILFPTMKKEHIWTLKYEYQTCKT